jgi:hypothetical protein
MSKQLDAEKMLDKTLADSFPASDPLSTLPNPSFDSFESQERAEPENDNTQDDTGTKIDAGRTRRMRLAG